MKSNREFINNTMALHWEVEDDEDSVGFYSGGCFSLMSSGDDRLVLESWFYTLKDKSESLGELDILIGSLTEFREALSSLPVGDIEDNSFERVEE